MFSPWKDLAERYIFRSSLANAAGMLKTGLLNRVGIIQSIV